MTQRHLAALLTLLFFALAIPAAVLVTLAFRQLELDSFRQQQILAEGFVSAIDRRLATAVAAEQARPAGDYSFALAPAGADGGFAVRSPLAGYPLRSDVPGALGYFQIDASGTLTTPLLPAGDPARFGLVDAADFEARRAAADALLAILSDNRLVGRAAATLADSPPAAARLDELAESPRGQAAFDRLALAAESPAARGSALIASSTVPAGASMLAGGSAVQPGRDVRQPDAEPAEVLRARTAGATAESDTASAAREEQRADSTDSDAGPARLAKVSTFASDIEPLVFSRLDTGHFVLFRNAWIDAERYVQGLLLDASSFLSASIGAPYAGAGIAPGVALAVDVGAARLYEAGAVNGDASGTRAVLRTRLSPPLADIELSFTAAQLPAGPVGDVLVWTSVVLFVVLIGGVYAMYRFGSQQIELARQQRNFVSAVSHELKTPLTSIRMYSEMLKAGWAGAAKRRDYYEFIYSESERLSRLIDNVLTLTRIGRGGGELEPATLAEVVDLVRSKVSGSVAQAGFDLVVELDEAVAGSTLRVDPDAIAQIFINLFDNALKFAAAAADRRIVLAAHAGSGNRAVLEVRDFGPGVAEKDMRHLFELFYRPDDELTRAISGTGIGLALVRQLASGMNARVDVRNAAPGAAFSISLPVADA